MFKNIFRHGHTTEALARTSTDGKQEAIPTIINPDDNCDASNPKSNQDISDLAAAASNAAATVKGILSETLKS